MLSAHTEEREEVTSSLIVHFYSVLGIQIVLQSAFSCSDIYFKSSFWFKMV